MRITSTGDTVFFRSEGNDPTKEEDAIATTSKKAKRIRVFIEVEFNPKSRGTEIWQQEGLC